MGSDAKNFSMIYVKFHFNPRSPRGERLFPPYLRENAVNFNPRSPRGERRDWLQCYDTLNVFQSTLPAWGATGRRHACSGEARYFNPRSPRGERQNKNESNNKSNAFQSTLPAWGATFRAVSSKFEAYISIHAPRVGSDSPYSIAPCPGRYFNPRSPRGERPAATS